YLAVFRQFDLYLNIIREIKAIVVYHISKGHRFTDKRLRDRGNDAYFKVSRQNGCPLFCRPVQHHVSGEVLDVARIHFDTEITALARCAFQINQVINVRATCYTGTGKWYGL